MNNPGPAPAIDVEVTDPLPSGTTFESASAPAGWTVTAPAQGSAGTVTFYPRQSHPRHHLAEITVRVGAAVPVGTTITNQATIASVTDSIATNNTVSRATTVSAGSDLAVTQTTNTATPQVGDMVIFSLVVTNQGPSPATGVQPDATVLPAGLSFAVPPRPRGPTARGTGLWAIGALAVDAPATLTLTARVDQPGVFTQTTTNLPGNQTDPDATNNQASTTLTVSAADIALTASIDQAAPRVGDTVTLTLTATNNGPDAVIQLCAWTTRSRSACRSSQRTRRRVRPMTRQQGPGRSRRSASGRVPRSA